MSENDLDLQLGSGKRHFLDSVSLKRPLIRESASFGAHAQIHFEINLNVISESVLNVLEIFCILKELLVTYA